MNYTGWNIVTWKVNGMRSKELKGTFRSTNLVKKVLAFIYKSKKKGKKN